MRLRTLACFAVCCIWLMLCVADVDAVSIIDDTFNGASLDTAIWDNKSTSPAYVSEINGVLQLHGTSAYPAKICSKSSFWSQPGTNQTLRVVFSGVSNSGSTSSVELSFSNGASRSPVHFGITTTNGVPTFVMADGTTGYSDSYLMSGTPLDGTWEIEWQPNRVKVYRYETLFFDSNVHAGQTSGTPAGQWPIPNKPLGVYVHSVPDYTTVDWIHMAFAPECGGTGFLKADLNSDCDVNLLDICKIAQSWMEVDGTVTSGSPSFQSSRGHRLLRDYPFIITGMSAPFPAEYDLARLRAGNLNTFMLYRGDDYGKVWAKRDYARAIADDMPWIFWTSHQTMTTAEVDEFGKWPGRVMFNIIDEPSGHGDPTSNFDQAIPVTQYAKDRYPSIPTIVNIGAGPQNYTEITELRAYLSDVVNLIKPDILSLDCYILIGNGGSYENRFWAALSEVRTYALNAGLPYWGWIQCSAPDPSWRRASESDLRYLVYKHLAFGFTGIQYWTYDTWGPETNDAGLIDTNGKYGPNGQPTPQYYLAQDVGIEINNIGPVLKRLVSKSVFHGGQNNPWPGLAPQFAPYENMTGFASSSSWTLGFFEDIRGEKYFMVVNDEHQMDQTAAQCAKSCTIAFSPSVTSLQKIDRRTAEVSTVPISNSQLSLTIPGGTGELYKYNTGQPFTAELCGENGYAISDIDHDCKTDLNDLAIVIQIWLSSSLPGQPQTWDCNSDPYACYWKEENWRIENWFNR